MVSHGFPEVSLDSLEALGAGLQPRAVKIDVEGAEETVLKGATELLRRTRSTWLGRVVYGGLVDNGEWKE